MAPKLPTSDPIVQEGNPVLRQRALPIARNDLGSPTLQKLIKRMHAALAPEKYGVAIAAPQVGEPLRVFVVAGRVFAEAGKQESPDAHLGSSQREPQKTPAPPPNRVYVNPEITRASRKKIDESEGCLSVRGKYGIVSRHERVSLRAWNERGEIVTENAAGLLAHIFQHEVDHLNGVLFIDKARDLRESD